MYLVKLFMLEENKFILILRNKSYLSLKNSFISRFVFILSLASTPATSINAMVTPNRSQRQHRN